MSDLLVDSSSMGIALKEINATMLIEIIATFTRRVNAKRGISAILSI